MAKKSKTSSSSKKRKAVSKAPPAEPVEDVDESSSSSEEETVPPVTKKQKVSQESSDSSSSSSSESESESESEQPPSKAKINGKSAPAKAESSSSSESESSDDSDSGSDSDEDEAMEEAKPAKADAESSSESDDSSSDDSSSDDSSDEDEPKEQDSTSKTVSGQKRKSPDSEDSGSDDCVIKKPKSENQKLSSTANEVHKGSCCVFIGNLSYQATEDEVSSFFKDCGEVSEVYFVTDRNSGRPRGMGFVTFATAEAALKACELNETELGGRQVRINLAGERKNAGGSDRKSFGGRNDSPSCNQFARTGQCSYGNNCRFKHDGSNQNQSSAGACHQFQRSGSCKFGTSCRFSHDGSGGAGGSRNFGGGGGAGACHQFQRSGSCKFGDSCRFSHSGGDGGGQRGGGRSRELSEKPDGCTTVFLGGLPYDIEESDVQGLLSDCGSIKQIRWVEKDGEFKGCAFVEFDDSNSTDAAVKKNSQNLKGRRVRVDYAKDSRR